jgi:hypothetical protein
LIEEAFFNTDEHGSYRMNTDQNFSSSVFIRGPTPSASVFIRVKILSAKRGQPDHSARQGWKSVCSAVRVAQGWNGAGTAKA